MWAEVKNMSERLHRTQILLEPELHRTLAVMANEQGRSISEIVREMLCQRLEQLNSSREEMQKRRFAALERIQQHREDMIRENRGQYLDFDAVEAIHQAREEQDDWTVTQSADPGS